MVGRTPQKSGMQGGPGFERLAPFDEVGVGGWQLPDAVRPPTSLCLECHQIAIDWAVGKVVEPLYGTRHIAECPAAGRNLDTCAVDMDRAAVAQARKVIASGLGHSWSPLLLFSVVDRQRPRRFAFGLVDQVAIAATKEDQWRRVAR